MSSMSFTNTHDDSSTQSLELITINDLYDTEEVITNRLHLLFRIH